VLCGNHRFDAGVKMGMSEFPCIVYAGDRQQAIARAVSDNQSGAWTEWDIPLLKDIFVDFENNGVDLEITGFNESELSELFGETPEEPVDAPPQIDKAEELNKKWQVAYGDLWQVGEHKLLCGDSCNADDVARVMGGGKVDMVFTDPPYGIDRGEGFEGFEGFRGFGKPIARRKHKDGEWDNIRPGKEAFDLILSLSDRVFIFGGNFFSDLLPQGNHWLVWDKNNTMPTFGDCELVWTNIARNSVKKYYFEYNGLIGKEKERVHPTQKPVGLLVKMIGDYGKADESVFDGFIGSGTTMLSAENLKMKCFGIEKSADFCACILERMTTAFPNISINKQGD
jgi:DNA modification methylase